MKAIVFATAAFMLAGCAAHAGGLLSPAPATTGDWGGFYAGLHYGPGTVKAKGATTSQSVDGDAYGVHAGYLRDFGEHVFGVEVDYDRLDGDGGANADMLRLRARAGMDMGRVQPYVSLGLARYDDDDGYDGTGLTYGLGVDFRMNGQVTLGMDYVRDSIDDIDGTGADIDSDAVRIRASFRF